MLALKQLNGTEQTGAFALMDSLVRHKVKHIFGYPGGAILPIYDELYKWEEGQYLKHILVRHEQGAAHAADGYARATGTVGVCFATSGPGATNLVSGIANAQMDSIPMVVITGQVGRAFIGTDAFQEVDILGITLPIVKHSYLVRDPRDIARIVAEAFFIAQNGRPGPVLIDIPKDVGLEKFIYKVIEPGQVNLPGYRPSLKASSRQILQAAKLIQGSNQPLLYVGGGAVSSNAHEAVKKLVEQFRIPITTTLMGKGIFDENQDLSLGMLGMHGTAYANYAVSECDLLITLGARFDDRVTGKLDEFACNARVIHVDIDPAEIGKNRVPQVAIVGDINYVVQELTTYLEERQQLTVPNTQSWIDRINRWKEEYPLIIPKSAENLSPQEVISSVSAMLPGAYFTTDVGQHQMWAAQFVKALPRRWISSAGLGTMGFGLPAAVGAKVGNIDQEVICISGDASFQMNMQELGTISQYDLDIKIIIVNNQWQGMVRQWQEAFYGGRYSHSRMDQGSPDFVKLAESFGIKGIKVSNRNEMGALLEEMIRYKGPLIVDFQVIENENCYPMVAPGKSNDQMLGIGSKSDNKKHLTTD
uniref:acetohydroxyacid synthase large subunit n=1 Tax=Timspurckia oligopyrenoides TaxID=708627 RepID=UPI001FCDCC40|nr:acetohydroxyacid synthase large subunit [Timspurckia oligopyrenoides]UNJ17570.1 acetohydroxyacid synthase large subunit [Timspurckia oligopyrenoides]